MSLINYLPWKILIVDDDSDVHDVTEMALSRLVFNEKRLMFLHAYSAKEAVIQLKKHPDTAIILLDVVMEEDNSGLELVKVIREELHIANARIIIRTGNPGSAPEESVTLNYDINDYRGKTELTALGLRTMIITSLRSYSALVTINDLQKEIDETQKELIYSLGEIAESHSAETGEHVKRVGAIALFMAKKLGHIQDDKGVLELAASMHDIGKLGVDIHILNKPGKLTPEEFEQIKLHCKFGYDLLSKSSRPLLKEAAIIAYEHHENYDGSGYPRGLKQEEIHLSSQIVAVIDVFDALMTKRVYKDAWPLNEVLAYMESERNKKFSPKVLDIFFTYFDEIHQIFLGA